MIFLDETGIRTDLTRTHARAPRGTRATDAVPHARWKTVTVVGAIGPDGPAATLAFEGPLDGRAFATFAERVLAPALRPGDIVVADNLAAHRNAAAARAIAAAGASRRFLPAYSPDFHPIERMWSKLKGHLRTCAARSTAAIFNALTPALASITPADCRGWYRGSGYTVP